MNPSRGALTDFLRIAFDDAAQTRAWATRADGNAAVLSAERHGLSAVMLHQLRLHGATLGPDAMTLLGRHAAGIVLLNARHRRLLLRVVTALEGLGVRPLVVKGWPLAADLYADPTLRPVLDVDVLVPPADAERVARALEGPDLPRFVDTAVHDVFEDHHHIVLSGTGGTVEVHFRLLAVSGRAVFQPSDLFSSLRESDVLGHRIARLSLEHEFVYLAAHAANHLFARLSWVLDLNLWLLKYGGADWAKIARLARQAHLATMVGCAMVAVENLFGTKAPPLLREGLQVPAWKWAALTQVLSPQTLEDSRLSTQRLRPVLLRSVLADSVLDWAAFGRDAGVRGFRRALAALQRA